MRGMKHNGLKGLFLVACLVLVATQAWAQSVGNLERDVRIQAGHMGKSPYRRCQSARAKPTDE